MDLTKVMQVSKVIDAAVGASKFKRDGLCRHVTEVLSSAAVLGGNDAGR
jgi:hypothetical protein